MITFKPEQRVDPRFRRNVLRWSQGVATAFGGIGLVVGAVSPKNEGLGSRPLNALVGAAAVGGAGGLLAYLGFIRPV